MTSPDPNAVATNILNKALHMEPNQILDMVRIILGPLYDEGAMSKSEVKRFQKQVFEVIKIRNHLAIMLDTLPIADPRQIKLFDDLSPSDFE